MRYIQRAPTSGELRSITCALIHFSVSVVIGQVRQVSILKTLAPRSRTSSKYNHPLCVQSISGMGNPSQSFIFRPCASIAAIACLSRRALDSWSVTNTKSYVSTFEPWATPNLLACSELASPSSTINDSFTPKTASDVSKLEPRMYRALEQYERSAECIGRHRERGLLTL
jgi:hypothetical protein